MTEATPADTLAALPGVARPRGLLLDFGSVISVSIFERHRETERILGLPAGRLDWLGALDPATDPLWQAMQRDEITERDYWATRARQTGEEVGEPGWDMRTMLSRIRQQDPAAVVRPAMAELVEAAHAQGVRLGILTNELELFHGRASMDRMPVLARFPVLVDATHTGILKPDPAAYALAVDAMGLAPQEILFVAALRERRDRGARSTRHRVVANIHRDVAGGPHAHVHQHRLHALVEHLRAHERELLALGVGRADQQHRAGAHAPAPRCAPASSNAASSMSASCSSSSVVITSGGDRIRLGPETRTIRPRR